MYMFVKSKQNKKNERKMKRKEELENLKKMILLDKTNIPCT